ncbi:MAG TPA: VOC family protein, partial [Acidobacteriota bacterium]|nr:VOC family protein [Acidobacteriota bacterium]
MDNLAGAAPIARPRFAFLHHISLPCENLDESKKFYIEVLGGELFHDTQGFSEVRIADIIIGLSEQSGGWTGCADEYPHYGLNVDPANFALAKSWLDDCAVPNYGWTRNYKTALLYFRDPSGNLLELYCDSGYDGVKELALGPRQGGQPLPLAGLSYRWSGKVGGPGDRRLRIKSFGHLSMPVRDLEQSKRFFTEVMGGEPMTTSDPATFVEVCVAGAVVGLSTRGGSWTGRDCEYPHYAFYADANNFLPMIEWLKAHSVATPGPWTRDGKKGLMYFRDPSGNLLEIYCGKDLPQAANFPRRIKQ